ncbi:MULTISPECIES: DUF2207 domain-containing protein [Paraliobacillus]|uniref:DUF2207 domain-containing protein n=1 Tax=Paraliobacillus TaxID=200903 RepID=UPI0013004BDE|nr:MULTISPECIES: DUF2207 domain-containing protein [Paraliobacillus]
MKIKHRLFCLFPLLLLLVSCGDNNHALTIESANIQANIDSDGTVHITELYTYHNSFNKTTRSMDDNIENFEAYHAPNQLAEKDLETLNLEPLTVKKMKNDYQISSSSENELKQIVFSYDIKDAITKYNDIADLQYIFFDEIKDGGIDDVMLKLSTPKKQKNQDTFIFFHSSNQPIIHTVDDETYYTYDFLSQSESIDFRFIFPAIELTNRPIDEAKNFKNELLISESALQSRYKNVEDNFNSKVSILLIAIISSIVIGAYLILRHPNTINHEKKNKKALLALMEKTDPLIVHYVNKHAKLTKEAIIAGLFSLHKRNIITLSEVPSALNQGTTFRFTWKRVHQKLDEPELHLKNWLFTKHDEQGPYFLLESMMIFEQNKCRSKKKRTTNSDMSNFDKWCPLLKKYDSFNKIKTNYIPFQLFSFSLVFFTLGMFTYLVLNDVWGSNQQYTVILSFTLYGAIVLVYNCRKLLLNLLLCAIFLQSLFFTFTTATFLYLAFIIIAGSLTFLIPTACWRSDMNELRRAIKLAKKLFKQNKYPIGITPKHIQNQMQYAIILNQESNFAQACKPIPPSLLVTGNYPLLHNSKHTAAVFDHSLQTISQPVAK